MCADRTPDPTTGPTPAGRPEECVTAVRPAGGPARLLHAHGPHDMSVSDPDAFTRVLERGHRLLRTAHPEACAARPGHTPVTRRHGHHRTVRPTAAP